MLFRSASCCTRRSSSSKSFAIVAVVCRFCFGASAMAPPPFRCPNETKRPKKFFWSLREFWAREHRRALGSCHSTLRLVEKFSRFALNGSITFILLLIALFCFLLLVIGLLCSFVLSLLRCFAYCLCNKSIKNIK